MDIIKKIKNFTYNERHCLGEGSFGKVYEGKADDGHKVAIKKIEQRVISNDSYLRNALETEITIMKKLHHPNIVCLEDVVITANSIYLIMEYCVGGDLRKYMRGRKLTEQQATQIIKQIVRGFEEISKHGIVHRDLKPANILVHEGSFKICDFGFARFFSQSRMSRTCVGTPIYMSPQVLNQKPYTQKTDVWSLGILYFQLLFGKYPYNGSTESELFNNITKYPLSIPTTNKFIIGVLKGTLEIDESMRWNWERVFETFEMGEMKAQMENMFYKKNSNEEVRKQSPQYNYNHLVYKIEDRDDSLNRSVRKIDPPKPKPRNLLAQQANEEQIKPVIINNCQNQNPRFLYFILIEFIVNPIESFTFRPFVSSLYKYTLSAYDKRIELQEGIYAKVLQTELDQLKSISNQIPKAKEGDVKKLAECLLAELQKSNINYKAKLWIERLIKNQYKYNVVQH